ncbi:WXG100 family type VII secretion target [Aestuariimicrobium ganziense]|uniref:WXG100 family type VII secretion target n=1 Tax=Aestuariimicrobium ganziense TaxID=2773677 RepID=UPI001944DAFF|nr:WXG100 family type VII secretion target [Aestuariimicrobium ganziense]
MGDFTSVNASAMETGIQDLGQAHKGLTNNLDELKGQLSSSLAQWDGAAREAYADVQRQWDQSAAKMSEIVAKMTSVLGQITEGYASNESKIRGNWS